MIIGLTGGIGCGKSTVLQILQEDYGFYIFEADRIAHELMEPGGEIYRRITEVFGRAVLQPDDRISREKLGNIVFHDKEALRQLDELTHPAVIEEITNRIEIQKEQTPDADFVVEAALLIESGCYRICDEIWYISVNETIREERLVTYRNYSVEKARSVMKQQLNHEDFLKYADVVINNEGTVEETKKEIQKKLVFSK